MNIIYNGNLDVTNRQIQAIQAIILLENGRDRELHETALNNLKIHREELLK